MSKETQPKYSDAGKGDKPRQAISPIEWAKRWEKIFGKKQTIKEKQNEKVHRSNRKSP